MSSRHLTLVALTVAAAATIIAPVALQAETVTVGFEALGQQQFFNPGNTFSEAGYTMTLRGPSGTFGVSGSPASCGGGCVFSGSRAFYGYNVFASTAGLEISGGGTQGFDLVSFDAANAFLNMVQPLRINVVGTLVGGGTVSALVSPTLAESNAFVTYTMPSTFTGLTSVLFAGTPGSSTYGIDNVVLRANSTVPEPSTWALLGSGLLAVGGVATRRSRRA